jgi:hypothetical protein
MDQVKLVATSQQFEELQTRLEFMSVDMQKIMFEGMKRSPTQFVENFFNKTPILILPNVVEEENTHFERYDTNHVQTFQESLRSVVSKLEAEESRKQQEYNTKEREMQE